MGEHNRKNRSKARHRRRSVSIPRGFLDYVVLQALQSKPMSGTELMDEIEEKTQWRPGPGSIYPLLKKLNKRGAIIEAESDEPGMKRFTITEEGNELLIEQKLRNQFREKFHSFRRMWLRIYKEMGEELYEVNLRLFESIEEISSKLTYAPVKTARVKEILERAIVEIEEIGKQQAEDAHQ